ncbi:hypothetical protein QJS66_19255 [Kocuria rhizophila]|nr:hypothetical protein QJS66_19255 [Kocuria rhizophila]
MPRTLNRRALLAAAASSRAGRCGRVLGQVDGRRGRPAGSCGPRTACSGTYNDLAAVANTLTQETGRQIRLMTSDTGIGRLAPLMTGRRSTRAPGTSTTTRSRATTSTAPSSGGRRRCAWCGLPGQLRVLVREDSGIKRGGPQGPEVPKLIARARPSTARWRRSSTSAASHRQGHARWWT